MVLGQVDEIDEATVSDLCARAARKYELSSADGTRRFDLVTKSLLQWSKNTNEDVYGNVFIWTDQGVPAAVASIFKFVRPKDDLDSEFHSLSVEPIKATVASQTVWQPPVGGITYRPLDGNPAVAAQSRLRSTQMRNIGRRFRAQREYEGNVTQLRFLTKEIFSYASEPRGVLDGAVFVFVDQTDPEVLLIIEARESENGERAWYYAIARFNTGRLIVHHRDKEVFRVENFDKFDVPTSPYTLFQRLQDDPAFDLNK
jgi:hypothetical protein